MKAASVEEVTCRDIGSEAGSRLYGRTVPSAVRKHTLARGYRLCSSLHDVRHSLCCGAAQFGLASYQSELRASFATQ